MKVLVHRAAGTFRRPSAAAPSAAPQRASLSWWGVGVGRLAVVACSPSRAFCRSRCDTCSHARWDKQGVAAVSSRQSPDQGQALLAERVGSNLAVSGRSVGLNRLVDVRDAVVRRAWIILSLRNGEQRLARAPHLPYRTRPTKRGIGNMAGRVSERGVVRDSGGVFHPGRTQLFATNDRVPCSVSHGEATRHDSTSAAHGRAS